MHILLADDKYKSPITLSSKNNPPTTPAHHCSEVNQKLFTVSLNKLHLTYTIAIVPDGQAALTYLSAPPSTHPRPDVIFMDVQSSRVAMPVMGGIEATDILRTRQPFTSDPSIPSTLIIAIIARPICSEDARLRSKGFDDVLRKPFRKEALLRMLGYWARTRVVPRSGGAPVIGLGPTEPGPVRGGRLQYG
ncbi:hypothetical protein BDW69DRAFT_198925 [Aspergillus filifer]